MKKFVRSIPFFKKGLNNFEAEQARNQGGAFAPLPKFSKHCIAILTFAETFKE